MRPHNETTVDQFTRQADAFAAAEAIRSEEALVSLISECELQAIDDSLDVACGPGIVVCAFAEVVRTATGVDLTPAMLKKCNELADSKNLKNVSFKLGTGTDLPFDDQSFSIVTSRYAFHHFLEPARVLKEMVRVCKPGGRVVVMDMVAPNDPIKAVAFNRMEKLRDPSHVGALTLDALLACFAQQRVTILSVKPYRMNVELEAVLGASFPVENDRQAVRTLIIESVDTDSMGVNSRVRNGKVYFTYPISIFVTKVPQVAL
jgi:SAM-dependent methyltransferase